MDDRLDDGTDDDSSGFRGCFISSAQNASYIDNSITNLKFQHKPKHHLSKSSNENRLIIYLGAKIP